MKKNILYLEFFIICIFLVIPPFTVKNSGTNQLNFLFSLTTVISLFSALFIFYKYEFLPKKNHPSTALNLLLKAGSSFLYFGFLISVHVIFLIISFYFKIRENSFNFEKNFINIIIAYINFGIAAFYEECLYRLYLPEMLNRFSKNFIDFYLTSSPENVKKRYSLILRIFVEILCINIFAFSHLYLGGLAVINAFICGIILRLCYLRNRTVLPGTVSHFLYNSFIFLQVIL